MKRKANRFHNTWKGSESDFMIAWRKESNLFAAVVWMHQCPQTIKSTFGSKILSHMISLCTLLLTNGIQENIFNIFCSYNKGDKNSRKIWMKRFVLYLAKQKPSLVHIQSLSSCFKKTQCIMFSFDVMHETNNDNEHLKNCNFQRML